MIVHSSLEGLEQQLKLSVDRSKIVYLHMPYKGVPSPAVLRTRNNDKASQEVKNKCRVVQSQNR